MAMTKRSAGRMRRKARVKRRISGGAERLRLSVFKSLKHIYAQIVDDTRGVTLASASSLEEAFRGKVKEMDKKAVAKEVGKLVAERCKGHGVKKVVFDRGGCKYIGRVAALADGAREGGLEF
jgi:large subunit ribosomal protein L18